MGQRAASHSCGPGLAHGPVPRPVPRCLRRPRKALGAVGGQAVSTSSRRTPRDEGESGRDQDVVLMQQLHDEHAAALWRFCMRLVNNDRGRAEDVVQETLLRAWRHRTVLEGTPAAVRAWLFTVARNIVIDEWRSRRDHAETPGR